MVGRLILEPQNVQTAGQMSVVGEFGVGYFESKTTCDQFRFHLLSRTRTMENSVFAYIIYIVSYMCCGV